MPDDPTPEPEPSFEQALSQLERIVASLERGEPELTAALAKYEKGVSLLTQCHRLLDQAEQSVALLTGVDEQGNPLTTPFDATATIAREAASRRSRQPGQPRRSPHETEDLCSSVHREEPSANRRRPDLRHRSTVLAALTGLHVDPPSRLWTIRWVHRVKYMASETHPSFVSQSFLGSWVDFRRCNVNNSEAYEVARVWKTDERAFPSRECWAISSSFRMCRVFPVFAS